MDKLELLYHLLKEEINEIDSLQDTNDFIRGIRMGYLHCVGIISDILKNG